MIKQTILHKPYHNAVSPVSNFRSTLKYPHSGNGVMITERVAVIIVQSFL